MARRITRTPGKISYTKRFQLHVFNKRISRRNKKWLKLFEEGRGYYKYFLYQQKQQPDIWYNFHEKYKTGPIPYKQHPNRKNNIKYYVSYL